MNYKLRKFRFGDGERFYEASLDSEIYRNMDEGFPKTLESCQELVSQFAKEQGSNQYVCAIEIEGMLAGSVGVFWNEEGVGAVGYWLALPYQGKGLMTRILKQFCTDVFGQYCLNEIQAKPHEDNIASCRILEKAGFVWDEHDQVYCLIRGGV